MGDEMFGMKTKRCLMCQREFVTYFDGVQYCEECRKLL